jgi:RNA polymerase sigma-70 factor (ECF subfamily)
MIGVHFGEVDRKRVWAACYRVTGCAADADEVLQEAFTRALETEPAVSRERPLEPWIMKVAVRLAIDRLRRRRETPYDGPWLPSPIEVDGAAVGGTSQTPNVDGAAVGGTSQTPNVDGAAVGGTSQTPNVDGAAASDASVLDFEDGSQTSARYERVESATFAFLLALEALSPMQRGALVLRDVLDLSASETAEMLDTTEANVRALHHRARVKLEAYDKARLRPTAAVRQRARDVLEALFGHLVSGDTKGALALLADGARLVNDAGGVYHAARKIIRGPERIVRFYLGLLKKLGMPDKLEVRILNGMPAVEMFYGHASGRYAPHLVNGVILDSSGRVTTVYGVLAPRKLTHLASSSA